MRVIAAFAIAALAAPGTAAAQDTLTPEGAATVRGNWTGAVTAEGRPPSVVVGWSVSVGPSGSAGPVRLRVLSGRDTSTVVGSGPWEMLPAEPGSYTFDLPRAIPYDTRQSGLALDQQVGGHAIVRTHTDGFPYALDVFRPPLADDARDVPYSERHDGQELMVAPRMETDWDGDRLGDQTQDVGDLRLLSASVARREADRVLLTARVRNVGTTRRDQPHIVVPKATGYACAGSGIGGFTGSPCAGAPLDPGAEEDLAIWIGGPEPTRLTVGAEGPDISPSDNTRSLAARLTVRAAPRARLTRRGLRVGVTSNQEGDVEVAARVVGLRLRRTIHFAAPGTRTVLVGPASRGDARRLARTVARHPRRHFAALLTARQRT